jgi:hypothetical protein
MGGSGYKWIFDCPLPLVRHQDFRGMSWKVWNEPPNRCLTAQLYDRRKSKPEDSPTFHVKYRSTAETD